MSPGASSLCSVDWSARGQVTKLVKKRKENRHGFEKVCDSSCARALLFTAAAFGQVKSDAAKPDRANVLLRFEKESTVSSNCSQTLGVITQSMLEVEGVKNAKIEGKNNAVQVSYDPGKTTPQRIVTAFNKENPDTPLRLSGANEGK